MFERRPMDENVAQPAVPPADETRRFVVDAVPETVIAVEEAKGMVCKAENTFAVYVFGIVVDDETK